jgi:hypothetical protein
LRSLIVPVWSGRVVVRVEIVGVGAEGNSGEEIVDVVVIAGDPAEETVLVLRLARD